MTRIASQMDQNAFTILISQCVCASVIHHNNTNFTLNWLHPSIHSLILPQCADHQRLLLYVHVYVVGPCIQQGSANVIHIDVGDLASALESMAYLLRVGNASLGGWTRPGLTLADPRWRMSRTARRSFRPRWKNQCHFPPTPGFPAAQLVMTVGGRYSPPNHLRWLFYSAAASPCRNSGNLFPSNLLRLR